MSKLTQVDTYLGPEMKSTGEVMGLGSTAAEALGKALVAAGSGLPGPGAGILLSLAARDTAEAMPLIRRLADLGYDLLATDGTADRIRAELGVRVESVTKKLNEGHPNVVDVIRSGRVSAVVNTITGDRRPLRDGFFIRRASVERRIPCFTSLDTLRAALEGCGPLATDPQVKTVEEYRRGASDPMPLAVSAARSAPTGGP
jgi:carbamoyl-phosphate synthase large subunit